MYINDNPINIIDIDINDLTKLLYNVINNNFDIDIGTNNIFNDILNNSKNTELENKRLIEEIKELKLSSSSLKECIAPIDKELNSYVKNYSILKGKYAKISILNNNLIEKNSILIKEHNIYVNEQKDKQTEELKKILNNLKNSNFEIQEYNKKLELDNKKLQTENEYIINMNNEQNNEIQKLKNELIEFKNNKFIIDKNINGGNDLIINSISDKNENDNENYIDICNLIINSISEEPEEIKSHINNIITKELYKSDKETDLIVLNAENIYLFENRKCNKRINKINDDFTKQELNKSNNTNKNAIIEKKNNYDNISYSTDYMTNYLHNDNKIKQKYDIDIFKNNIVIPKNDIIIPKNILTGGSKKKNKIDIEIINGVKKMLIGGELTTLTEQYIDINDKNKVHLLYNKKTKRYNRNQEKTKILKELLI
jgi:hypothetical protein